MNNIGGIVIICAAIGATLLACALIGVRETVLGSIAVAIAALIGVQLYLSVADEAIYELGVIGILLVGVSALWIFRKFWQVLTE